MGADVRWWLGTLATGSWVASVTDGTDGPAWRDDPAARDPGVMVAMVTAVIKPHRLESVIEALRDTDVQGVTASEVRGFGRQGGHTETYRGTEYHVDFIPKVRVEILVAAEDADAVADKIVEAARTDKIGDGKVWISQIDSVIRIRTGERGTDAL